jgi:hypothetical protein
LVYLAGDNKFAQVKKKHAKWIPETIAASAPPQGAYEVNWKAYTWKNKTTGPAVDGKK